MTVTVLCSVMSEEKKNSQRGMNVIIVNGQLLDAVDCEMLCCTVSHCATNNSVSLMMRIIVPGSFHK